MNLEKEIKIYTKLTIVPKLHIFLKDGTKLKKKIKDQNQRTTQVDQEQFKSSR